MIKVILRRFTTLFLFWIILALLAPLTVLQAQTPSTKAASNIEVTFTVDETNELAFIAHITLLNKSATPLNDWLLGFTFQRKIDSLTGAKIEKQIGDYYVVGPDAINKTIPANGKINFVIRGGYTIRSIDDVPAGYFLITRDAKGQNSRPLLVTAKAELLPWKPARGLVPGIDDYAQNLIKNSASIEGNPVDTAQPVNASLIVPLPVSLQRSKGDFTLNSQTLILSESNKDTLLKSANFLKEALQPATGYLLNVKINTNHDPIKNNTILLTTRGGTADLGTEGYTLTVTPQNIIIRANSDAGLFYGVQSLRQLLPPTIFNKKIQPNVRWMIPSLTIKDYPRFSYRGVLLDVARHFFTIDEIKRLMDLMAIHKLNVFHWHLTDDEGFRIQIKRYPQLTAIGGWRGYDETLPPALGSGPQKNGGFYTQDEVRDLINYANDLHITIIPEIDVPGHSRAMIQSLPALLIDPQDKTVYSSIRGFHDNVISPCIDSTYEVLNNIMDEIVSLFPSHYVHIGSDERAKDAWKDSPNCIALMKKLALNNTEQLQNYFMNRMQTMLAKKNRAIGAWEEILRGGSLQKNPMPLIYSWTGIKAGIKAAEQGYDVIMSPAEYLYLELSYGADPLEPGDYWGGYLDTFKVYSYQPTGQLPANIAQKIKGIEGALWSEYINSAQRLDYFSFPKLAAVAEIAWTPIEKRNWQNFSMGLSNFHLPRLDNFDVFYRLSPPGVQHDGESLKVNNEFPGLVMRYTLDESIPTLSAQQYLRPIKTTAKIVKVRSFNTQNRGSSIVTDSK